MLEFDIDLVDLVLYVVVVIVQIANLIANSTSTFARSGSSRKNLKLNQIIVKSVRMIYVFDLVDVMAMTWYSRIFTDLLFHTFHLAQIHTRFFFFILFMAFSTSTRFLVIDQQKSYNTKMVENGVLRERKSMLDP